MPRMLCCLILASVLLLTAGTAALAAPVFPASASGEYYVYGEIGSDFVSTDQLCLAIGSGYAMSNELTVGAEVLSGEDGWSLGGFVCYYTKPLAVNADIRWAFPGLSAKLDVLYLLDVERFKAGVGVGALLNPDDILFFVEGTASAALGKDLSAYVTGEYFPNMDDLLFQAGVSYAF